MLRNQSQGPAPEFSQGRPAFNPLTADAVSDFLMGNTGRFSLSDVRQIKAAADTAHGIIYRALHPDEFAGRLPQLTDNQRADLKAYADGVLRIAMLESYAAECLTEQGREEQAPEQAPAESSEEGLISETGIDSPDIELDAMWDGAGEGDIVHDHYYFLAAAAARFALCCPSAKNARQREALRNGAEAVAALFREEWFATLKDDVRRAFGTGETLKAVATLAADDEDRRHWANPQVNIERLPAMARAFLWFDKFTADDVQIICSQIGPMLDAVNSEIEESGTENGEAYYLRLCRASLFLEFLLEVFPSPRRAADSGKQGRPGARA